MFPSLTDLWKGLREAIKLFSFVWKAPTNGIYIALVFPLFLVS